MATIRTPVEMAIETSIATDAIVHLSRSDIGLGADGALEAAHSELLAECEDSADVAGETEYWGTTENGSTWRVHAEVPASAVR